MLRALLRPTHSYVCTRVRIPAVCCRRKSTLGADQTTLYAREEAGNKTIEERLSLLESQMKEVLKEIKDIREQMPRDMDRIRRMSIFQQTSPDPLSDLFDRSLPWPSAVSKAKLREAAANKVGDTSDKMILDRGSSEILVSSSEMVSKTTSSKAPNTVNHQAKVAPERDNESPDSSSITKEATPDTFVDRSASTATVDQKSIQATAQHPDDSSESDHIITTAEPSLYDALLQEQRHASKKMTGSEKEAVSESDIQTILKPYYQEDPQLNELLDLVRDNDQTPKEIRAQRKQLSAQKLQQNQPETKGKPSTASMKKLSRFRQGFVHRLDQRINR